MNGNDTKTGIILATILLGGTLLKKKKAEAAEAAIYEKPPLAVAPVIPRALVRAQDEGVPSTVPQVSLPPIKPPISPAPVVKPALAPTTSTGLTSEILQKLQQLTQKQIVPTTKTVTLDAKPIIPATTPPTTQVAIAKPISVITPTPIVAPATLTVEEPEQVTLSDATQPFVAELDRSIIDPSYALGSWLSKQFKSVERSIRKEVKRSPVYKEAKRAEQSVRKEVKRSPIYKEAKRAEQSVRKEVKRSPIYKELKRAEQSVRKEVKRTERRVRHELKRFERRIRKNLAAIATVISVLGYIFPVLKLAAYALNAIVAYKNYATAKTIKKKIEGQQKYVAEVTEETDRMLASPTTLATKAKGGTLGYLFKNRINSSFVPLVSVNNVQLNDSFYTTMEMLPVLNAANYTPGKAVGFISKVPFSGSATLQLMYSFEMMDFVTVTGGSKYFQELSKNGYTVVKQLGYVSKQPQEGPHTNKKPTEIERVK